MTWCDSWKSSARELRSSVESVKMDEALLALDGQDDKNAEAALKSSSRSETVSSELPIDLVALEQVDNCRDSQSSTSKEEQNPDSHEPRLLCSIKSPCMEDAPELDPELLEKLDSTESSWVVQTPPEYNLFSSSTRPWNKWSSNLDRGVDMLMLCPKLKRLVDLMGEESVSKKVGVAARAGLGNSKHELKRSLDEPMIFLPSRSLGRVAKGF